MHHTTPSVFVGAYPCSPCQSGWNPTQEALYFSKLYSYPLIEGLELPVHRSGKLHPYDVDWLRDQIVNHLPNWTFILTTIPGTIEHLKDDLQFGLASSDEDGRQRAIEWMKLVHQGVSLFNSTIPPRPNNKNSQMSAVISLVHIHTAPQHIEGQIHGTKEALKLSLTELTSWNWHGAKLVIEHCDAYRPGQVPAKGFLELADELEVVSQISKPDVLLGVTINWGRSAYEQRNTIAPIEHIQQCSSRKFANSSRSLLAGVFFSGCAVDDPIYGTWQDNHVPFSVSQNSKMSLLTPEETKKCLQACNLGKDQQQQHTPIIGIKISPRPKTFSIDQVVEFITDGISVISSSLSDIV